jgi:hypothetical protein
MKYCKFNKCRKELPQSEHGNREYCDDNCYYLAKLERNNLKYANNRKKLIELNRVESILRLLYHQYGSANYIEASLLNERAMNWSFFSAESKVEDHRVKVVGEYAYCLFVNKTVRIWKI